MKIQIEDYRITDLENLSLKINEFLSLYNPNIEFSEKNIFELNQKLEELKEQAIKINIINTRMNVLSSDGNKKFTIL